MHTDGAALQGRKSKTDFYSVEQEAARASDTLAMSLLSKGEQDHTLNFSEEEDEDVHFKGIGVAYYPNREKWRAYRWRSSDKKKIEHGWYKDKETAAHASDNLVRLHFQFGAEQDHELNFPNANETIVPKFLLQVLSKKMLKLYRKRKALIQALEADFTVDEGPLIQVEDKIESTRKKRSKLKIPDDYWKNKRKRSDHDADESDDLD